MNYIYRMKSRFFNGMDTFLKTFDITDNVDDFIIYSAIQDWMKYMNISYLGIETHASQYGYTNFYVDRKIIEGIECECLVGVRRKQHTALDSFLKSVEHGPGVKPVSAVHATPIVAYQTKHQKQKIPKSVKTHVWELYIGPHINEHRCLCCKKTLIKITNFDVGHVISEANGGTLEIGNLRPICSVCNFSMKTVNMVEFVKKYGYYIG